MNIIELANQAKGEPAWNGTGKNLKPLPPW